MQRFLIRRLLFTLMTILVMSVLVFFLSRAKGDPRVLFLTEHTTQEVWDEWGRKMGLDRPLVMQYLIWLGRALQGDLGDSIRESRPVTAAVGQRVPATLQLAGLAWVFNLALGVPLGVLAAIRRGSLWDYSSRILATVGQAAPQFWVAIVLIFVFALQLDWLPAGRKGSVATYVLPVFVLGPLTAAGTMRLVRSSMLEALDTEFVKLARAKGVSNFKVIWKHALRNALIPVVTYAGLFLASFLTGSIIVETVFAWPGVGRLAVESARNNDVPLLIGVVLFFTLIFLTVNLIVDMVYAFLDPRIRYG